MAKIESISIEEILAARERIAGLAIRSPLIRLNHDAGPAEIYLKLENLQPIGSFKLRGAGNAMGMASPDDLQAGVYTASAGNMAQGVAWVARERGIPCAVVVPEHAPANKLAAIERLGGRSIKVPWDEWWQVIEEHRYPGLEGLFIHPVCDPAVVAGNGSIGLEILEDLPDVDAIIAPYGGGGLSSGIASAMEALKPEVEVHAAELELAAPLRASLAAGEPVEVPFERSFIDGISAKAVLTEIWPLVQRVIASSIVVSVEQICDAIRMLAERNRVIAEGAGAASVAAALTGAAGSGKVVCVVSGGNLDLEKLQVILAGGIPG
ncbi:MAG: threonine ammonia-lyase [Planctomycetota bacterium]|jgi:threonine dehydratase